MAKTASVRPDGSRKRRVIKSKARKAETANDEESHIVTPAAKQEEVQTLDPSRLKPHPKNQHIYGDEPDASLLEDIQHNGIRDPLIADRQMRVVSGRRRHKAAIQLGLPTVPVIVRDFDTEDDETLAIVKHNSYRVKSPRQIMFEVAALMSIERMRARGRMSEAGRKSRPRAQDATPDEGPEQQESREVVLEDGTTVSVVKKPGVKRYGRKGKPGRVVDEIARAIGQPISVVQRIMSIVDDIQEQLGEDADWTQHPEIQAIIKNEKTISRVAAELLGERRERAIQSRLEGIDASRFDIRCQDHIDDIPTGSINHVITDPDYDVETGYGERLRDGAEWLNIFEEFPPGGLLLDQISGWVAEWGRVLRTHGNLAVFCPPRYLSFMIEALTSQGFSQIDVVTWHRTNPPTTAVRTQLIDACQHIVVACRTESQDRLRWKGIGQMHNFVEGPGVKGKERLGLKSQKPEFVVKWLVERITGPGDTILDNFAGTGTVGAVCKTLRRHFILVERDEKLVDTMKVRLGS